ncbi:hypothetical protein [Microcoleus sp. AR_TQ3_B6]|uniref:hypothetical protein n=1 Tax=Microcoleus sp. AR_TQ3_B6 TaxID=3055284 RepID=UPI00403F0EE9
MTDPLQSYDVELLKRYGAELQEIETLPPAAIELPADQALAFVTLVQIVTAANPAIEHHPLLPSAIAAAKQIQSRRTQSQDWSDYSNSCRQGADFFGGKSFSGGGQQVMSYQSLVISH